MWLPRLAAGRDGGVSPPVVMLLPRLAAGRDGGVSPPVVMLLAASRDKP